MLRGVGLRELVDDVHPVSVRIVDPDERLPLVRQCVFREDRLDGALRLTGAAVDALLRVDHEHPRGLVDAIDRADVDAGLVFDVDTGLGDDVRHATYSTEASRPSISSPARSDSADLAIT